MQVLIDKNDKSKHHHIIMDHMSSLNVEMVVDFLPYQRKNIMDQMSALKVKVDVLNELIDTKNSARNIVEGKISLLGEKLLSTPSEP